MSLYQHRRCGSCKEISQICGKRGLHLHLWTLINRVNIVITASCLYARLNPSICRFILARYSLTRIKIILFKGIWSQNFDKPSITGEENLANDSRSSGTSIPRIIYRASLVAHPKVCLGIKQCFPSVILWYN